MSSECIHVFQVTCTRWDRSPTLDVPVKCVIVDCVDGVDLGDGKTGSLGPRGALRISVHNLNCTDNTGINHPKMVMAYAMQLTHLLPALDLLEWTGTYTKVSKTWQQTDDASNRRRSKFVVIALSLPADSMQSELLCESTLQGSTGPLDSLKATLKGVCRFMILVRASPQIPCQCTTQKPIL